MEQKLIAPAVRAFIERHPNLAQKNNGLPALGNQPNKRFFFESVKHVEDAFSVYGNSDIVHTSKGPALMEMEVIEPDLFIRHSKKPTFVAENLARAVLERIGK